MSNVVNLHTVKGKYQVEYFYEGDKIVAVSNDNWPFRIMRKDDRIALVCKDTDEPFGELDADVFNTILACWLLIDDHEIVKLIEEER